MGRLGVTFSEVATVANDLIQEGLSPTVDAVRFKLGTGSKTTIVAHLKRWRSSLQEEGSATTPPLPPELMVVIKKYYQQLEASKAAPTSEAGDELTKLRKKIEVSEHIRSVLLRERSYLIGELKKLKKEVQVAQAGAL